MKKISLLIALLFCFSLSNSFAQFEGKINFKSYNIDDSGSKKSDDNFTMYITPDRILFRGDKDYKVAGTLKAEGILIRQKEEDFVFLTGDKQAMKITKAGITSFMNMFGDARSKAQKTENNIEYKRTDETKKIEGYTCQKFIFTNKDKPDESSTIWMTKGLKINWGMLAEPWGDTLHGLISNDGGNLPLNLIFKEGYFPVRMEQYKKGKLTGLAEATEITPTDIARQMVQIPSDMQVISLQDYIFQKMRSGH